MLMEVILVLFLVLVVIGRGRGRCPVLVPVGIIEVADTSPTYL
jgi:hypothetical protein